MVLAVNACGNSVLPMFLFPRKKFFGHFICDGPTDCIGASNGSGWMNEECFVTYMKHFIWDVKPKKESPVLLLLDNHQSHLSIQLITLCKDNGIVLLFFPLHCSHKLQPLDRSVFGPFKKYLANAQNSWMKSSPGKVMSKYDLPGISKIASLHSLTQLNITSDFAVAGISPYNLANDTSISTSMSDAIPSTSGSFVMSSFSRLLPVALEFSPGVVRPLPKV